MMSPNGTEVEYIVETVQIRTMVEFYSENGKVYYNPLGPSEVSYETATPYLEDGEMIVSDEYGDTYKLSECKW